MPQPHRGRSRLIAMYISSMLNRLRREHTPATDIVAVHERSGDVAMKRPASRAELETMLPFMSELVDTLIRRGRLLLRNKAWRGQPAGDLPVVGEALLSRRGEASGVALAHALLAGFEAASSTDRLAFLHALADRFGPDRGQVELAIEAVRSDPSSEALERLHAAAEPRRQELIRRLNLAPGGTSALVRMRENLLGHLPAHPSLRSVDADFSHLFCSWFNRGFLVLQGIDWTTPANILEKVIQYEAVHAIRDWDDLRNRLLPADRRCYAFFHPRLVDEPLIFVEVALTREVPGAIGPLLDLERTPIAAAEATTAVFYSISNTQKGLHGVSFGNFLIKQVVESLRSELPNLQTFVTLSPVPGFASWLRNERRVGMPAELAASVERIRPILEDMAWPADPSSTSKVRATLLAAAANYLLNAKDGRGRPLDPVARFHLGNGARLERLNLLADLSEKGMRQALGLMVNYKYALDDLEQNHEAFVEHGVIAASPLVRSATRIERASRDLLMAS